MYSHNFYFASSLFFSLVVASQSIFSMEIENSESKELIKNMANAQMQKNILLRKNLFLPKILTSEPIIDSNIQKQITAQFELEKQNEKSEELEYALSSIAKTPKLRLPKQSWLQWITDWWTDEPFLDWHYLWIPALPAEITFDIIFKRLVDVSNPKELRTTAQTILNLASVNTAFNIFFNSPSVMKTLLQSVPIDAAVSLADQMGNMRVMKRPEMIEWLKSAYERSSNSVLLFHRIKLGEKALAMELLKKTNIDVNLVNKITINNVEIARTPLLEAVINEHKRFTNADQDDIIQNLLKAGANPNSRDNDGQTSLIIACKEANTKIVGMLLAANADVNHKDKHGKDALSWTIEQRHTEIAKILFMKWICHRHPPKNNFIQSKVL
jgi:ankyrin repeat protein